jgi:hypothetical protein
VGDLLTVFASRTDEAREALRKALAGERLKARPDLERGLRGRGRVRVSVARSTGSGPRDREVAGGDFPKRTTPYAPRGRVGTRGLGPLRRTHREA